MTKHGHVTPNADGSKARCGGPMMCPDCALEFANQWIGKTITFATPKPAPLQPGEIIACPFCREAAEPKMIYGLAWAVECMECKASGPMFELRRTYEGRDARTAAIDAWNTRP